MNTLYKMTKEEFEKKKILYKFNDVKYIVMDGAGIETYEQYFDKLWEVFGFSEIPEGWKKDYHTEYDFMTDDDFLPFEKYTFVMLTGIEKVFKTSMPFLKAYKSNDVTKYLFFASYISN